MGRTEITDNVLACQRMTENRQTMGIGEFQCSYRYPIQSWAVPAMTKLILDVILKQHIMYQLMLKAAGACLVRKSLVKKSSASEAASPSTVSQPRATCLTCIFLSPASATCLCLHTLSNNLQLSCSCFLSAGSSKLTACSLSLFDLSCQVS